jgi:hypothetical protein
MHEPLVPFRSRTLKTGLPNKPTLIDVLPGDFALNQHVNQLQEYGLALASLK